MKKNSFDRLQDELKLEELTRLVKEEFKKLVSYGYNLYFTDDAVREIAENAVKRKRKRKK
jgi:hypothetical protein